MSISSNTTNSWWRQLRTRVTLLYLAVAIALLAISAVGHFRLLHEVGKTFGGFFWANVDGKIVVVSTPSQLPAFEVKATSLTSSEYIVTANHIPAETGLTATYQHATDKSTITYTIAHDDVHYTLARPTATFTLDMWWQSYGLTLLAGICWLIAGGLLLARSKDWNGAVEGLTLLPIAMLLLLYSHWGNVQQAATPDAIFQFLWVPSFALLGAAFIHLSLLYRPEEFRPTRRPHLLTDGLPYLPVLLLVIYEWGAFVFTGGHIPTRTNLILGLGYAVLGGSISFCIGIYSLLRLGHLLPFRHTAEHEAGEGLISPPIRQRIGDLLTLWVGSIGLGFFLGVLPIFLFGSPLLPLPMFYLLAAVYPLVLLYAIRSLRLINRLHITLEEREEALDELQKTAGELGKTNDELKHATSLLLQADAHLRSILSQRIHDQPRQQALRIRSLLGHWLHKLRVEAERDEAGKVSAQPVIEALGKVRRISEELESDLRGLQLLVEDVYQRRSLGLKLHLEKLIREDLPALHPESPLHIQADLRALDVLSTSLEETEEGAKIAEAISYTVTQALLNIYNHAGATLAEIRTQYVNSALEVYILDDGRGFDTRTTPLAKTSLFKAKLKTREAGGNLLISSVLRPQDEHGTIVKLSIPLPPAVLMPLSGPLQESRLPGA
ncbi:hypothetical protein EPA93_43430 [Ktedonosporobacter rubrisoli]|uniref:Histidine kinase/HSP90-like ATPase domain-containing protein n=1 Tax=Ktedonosporobacter rubrisoli TaxID=2509675 RepID=A0A4P6K2M1_KTERU|nr:hypothetical protein [Ktedonosporobacter rubrisoli]QBD82468.1 hypothetical protein EPA93_43430 [Ktedonosporobacter rubrisoli]